MLFIQLIYSCSHHHNKYAELFQLVSSCYYFHFSRFWQFEIWEKNCILKRGQLTSFTRVFTHCGVASFYCYVTGLRDAIVQKVWSDIPVKLISVFVSIYYYSFVLCRIVIAQYVRLVWKLHFHSCHHHCITRYVLVQSVHFVQENNFPGIVPSRIHKEPKSTTAIW